MPAKPPVPGKDVPINPLCGIQQSKIDYFALGETVKKLRNSGLSLVEITDELNTKYVTDPNYKISTMSVCRWADKNMSEEIDLRYSEETRGVFSDGLVFHAEFMPISGKDFDKLVKDVKSWFGEE